jgi:hypothetical protein|tara:strand:- start:209 stop:994 length:786 start_codon:yes stop_codon:yes gene_type:complete
MAIVDKFLVNSFLGWMSQEEADKHNVNLIVQGHEIFQTRVFCYLVEQICGLSDKETINMVELGADVGDYTKFFKKIVGMLDKKSFNVCTDVCPKAFKQLNEKFNDVDTKVYHGYSGTLDKTMPHLDLNDSFNKITLTDLLSKNNIEYIDFLHMDIQGGEEEVIEEIVDRELCDKIGCYFISTHEDVSPGIHQRVINRLNDVSKIIIEIEQPAFGWAFGDGFILAVNTKLHPLLSRIPSEYTNFSTKFNDVKIPGILRYHNL